MNVLFSQTRITCILPVGNAHRLMQLLYDEKGINTSNVYRGRGLRMSSSIGYEEWQEVEIVSVIVPSGKADEIFEYLYDKTDIGKARGAFMYQNKLIQSTAFKLPEIPGTESK